MVNSSQTSDIKIALQELDKELAALRDFVVLLAAEQQSLLNNDIEVLLAQSEAKTHAISHLMELGNVRRKSLLTNSADTMESWLAKHAPGSLQVWNTIRKLAEESQHLNRINGELINTRMRQNQQALTVLHNASKNAAGLYGPDGQSNMSSSGRHLGSG